MHLSPTRWGGGTMSRRVIAAGVLGLAIASLVSVVAIAQNIPTPSPTCTDPRGCGSSAGGDNSSSTRSPSRDRARAREREKEWSFDEGRDYFARGDWNNAIRSFEEALVASPDDE